METSRQGNATTLRTPSEIYNNPAAAGWDHNFATREHHFRPSPVRAVFETAMRPDVVSLAGGNPDLSFLPHELISEVAARAIAKNGLEVLQYGSGAGTDKSRELSAALMTWGGADYHIDEIQMTSGSQAGLDAVTKVLCDPGDVIIAEAPTYVGVLGTFGAYEVDVRQVPLDEDGLDPAAVAELIDRCHAEGRRVRYVYTISAYQNPSGMSLSPSRHAELIEVCARRGVWVVEDDAYGLLGFEALNTDSNPTGASVAATPATQADDDATGPNSQGQASETKKSRNWESAPSLPGGAELIRRAPMLAATSKENVIHLGSYSKIFSPGTRVGWIGAPVHLRERLQIACESVCITPSVISQTIVEEYVGTPQWRRSLLAQLEAYRQRRDVSVTCAEQLMPAGTTWNVPEGGFFLWMSLPEGDWGDVLELGLREEVVIIPGSGCYVEPEVGTHIRVAFSAVVPEVIEEGFRRLSLALSSPNQP